MQYLCNTVYVTSHRYHAISDVVDTIMIQVCLGIYSLFGDHLKMQYIDGGGCGGPRVHALPRWILVPYSHRMIRNVCYWWRSPYPLNTTLTLWYIIQEYMFYVGRFFKIVPVYVMIVKGQAINLPMVPIMLTFIVSWNTLNQWWH